MKTHIQDYIKNTKNTNFKDLFNNCLTFDENFEKNELKNIIRELEEEQFIISAFQQIYHRDSLTDKEGFIQWNMNGFCWVDNEEKSNSYGITFDIPQEAIPIFNKRKAFMSSYSKGKIVEYNDKQYYYWENQDKPVKDFNFIYYVSSDNKCWLLNHGQKISVPITEQSMENNSVNIAFFNHETGEFKHSSKLGLLSDKGIESDIVYQLGELSKAPQVESDTSVEYTQEVKDLTKKKFFTIDSIYTKDMDDAIAFEKSKTGYSIWVAITDVSHGINSTSQADQHASKVANTFYLNHKTVHMLDKEMAEKDFSLKPGELRNALVCKMNFDFEGNMKKSKIFPAQIISHARLTYDDVNLMLDNKKPEQSIFIDNNQRAIRNCLISLNHYRQLKPLNNSKLKYHKVDYNLNDLGKISELYHTPEATDADKIVEDAMLRTNMVAAKHLFNHYPEIGLFRNQLVPENIQKPKAASYGEHNDGHWGLGAEFYTHFTSPIRRYCDSMVHRMIKDTWNGTDRTYSKENLEEISHTINIQQNKSKQIHLKESNLLINQYVAQLFESKKLGKTLTVLDITDTGVVTENKQKIEYFIPTFKLSREIHDKLSAIQNDDDKQKIINELNSDYKILGFVDEFNWLEDKKNVSYYMRSKKELQEKQQQKELEKNQLLTANITPTIESKEVVEIENSSHISKKLK